MIDILQLCNEVNSLNMQREVDGLFYALKYSNKD